MNEVKGRHSSPFYGINMLTEPHYSKFNSYEEFDAYFRANKIGYFSHKKINTDELHIGFYDENGVEIGYDDGDMFHTHRLDGPAVFFSPNFMRRYHPAHKNSWYINDRAVDNQLREWTRENNIDLDNLTEVDKALIKIVWANYGK